MDKKRRACYAGKNFAAGENMIEIRTLKIGAEAEFYEAHGQYLQADIFPHNTLGEAMTQEDHDWFFSEEYRAALHHIRTREVDRGFFAAFVQDGTTIGYCSWCTYLSEDGKCFILDFWVLPQFRGKGIGGACFRALAAYERARGANYFELNVSNPRNKHFWETCGFVENGADQWGSMLMILPPQEALPFTCGMADAVDVPQILELMGGYKLAIGEAQLTDAQKEALGEAIAGGRIAFFLAKRGWRAIGMCSVCETFSTFQCRPGGVFEDFYVLPAFRKNGAAKLLADAAFAHCRARGIAALWVGCADSDAARYKHLGFTIPLGNLLTWAE